MCGCAKAVCVSVVFGYMLKASGVARVLLLVWLGILLLRAGLALPDVQSVPRS